MSQHYEADDKPISNETNLLRRIAPVYYIEGSTLGTGFRVSSAAFKNDKNSVPPGFSVVIEDLTPHTHEQIALMKSISHGLVSLTVGIVREHKQTVKHSPNDREPGHGDVIGDKPKEVRDIFAALCRVLIEPNSLNRDS